jgi:hypothetical protein
MDVRPPHTAGDEHQEDEQGEETKPQEAPEPAEGFHARLNNT